MGPLLLVSPRPTRQAPRRLRTRSRASDSTIRELRADAAAATATEESRSHNPAATKTTTTSRTASRRTSGEGDDMRRDDEAAGQLEAARVSTKNSPTLANRNIEERRRHSRYDEPLAVVVARLPCRSSFSSSRRVARRPFHCSSQHAAVRRTTNRKRFKVCGLSRHSEFRSEATTRLQIEV